MQDPAVSILNSVCSEIFNSSLLSYFILNKKGGITHWGGSLRRLNMIVPKAGTPISEVAVFMEGILPLQGKAMEFSCIKMEPDICIDAKLIKLENGYGLMVWDATQKDAYLTQTQQQCNELSLLIEAQKNKISSPPFKHLQGETEFLEELFLALNFAVLEMNDDGHFVLIGTPPPWIGQLPQSSRLVSGQRYEDDVFSFLGNFIQEAKERWQKNPSETFKSGIWIEKDHTGQEYLFESTGVSIHGKKLLIIANDVCHPNETQSIIQKGRELALHYHDLKKADLELKNTHQELEERVRERTRDLETANLKLAEELRQRKRIEKEREEVSNQLRQSQKMEAIGTLAGGIAHDFNNILSAIMGFTELSIIESQENESVKSKLKKILHASDRARELVHQILTFSRQTEIEKRPLKLRVMVKEVLKLLRASLPAFIEINENLKCDAYILADPTQIHQVIMNLCTNAWHAMKEKGGTLSVSISETQISSRDLVEMPDLEIGHHLVLTIKDTGHGIPKDLLERIFDPYFTTKDINKGTGLGLSVVHGIVTACKGAITVSSEPDAGSEFKVILPAFDSPRDTAVSKEPMPFGSRERVLFVDDEVFQTEMAEELLHRLGYQPTTENDSEAALNRFMEDPDQFDLVITDMIMPKLSGKALAEKMLEKNPRLPIILCSGYSDDIDPDTIQESGIVQYLMKPISMENLAYSIRNALKPTQA